MQKVVTGLRRRLNHRFNVQSVTDFSKLKAGDSAITPEKTYTISYLSAVLTGGAVFLWRSA
jgi:hypothetical protein